MRRIIPTTLGRALTFRMLTPDKPPTPTAHSIAQDLLDSGLKDDELFDAMWSWQNTAGIEPFTIYQEYKQLTEHQPEEQRHS